MSSYLAVSHFFCSLTKPLNSLALMVFKTRGFFRLFIWVTASLVETIKLMVGLGWFCCESIVNKIIVHHIELLDFRWAWNSVCSSINMCYIKQPMLSTCRIEPCYYVAYNHALSMQSCTLQPMIHALNMQSCTPPTVNEPCSQHAVMHSPYSYGL